MGSGLCLKIVGQVLGERNKASGQISTASDALLMLFGLSFRG